MIKLHSSLISIICSRACLLLACGATGLIACSGGGGKDQPAEAAELETGTVRLQLTARGASGALYRLRNATFQVEQLGDGSGPTPPIPVPEPPPFPGPIRLRPAPIFDDVPGTSGAGGRGTPGGMAGAVGSAGTATGGAPGSGGSAPAAGSGGAAGFAGAAGSVGGSGSGGFVTFLSTENDPLATTLEANLPRGQFLITLFDGWFLERVLGGEVTSVSAELVSPQSLDFFIAVNEETFVSYRFQTNGDVVEFGEGRLVVDIEVDEVQGGGGEDPRSSVMENAREALPFSLEETLAAALRNAGSNLDALSAYHGIVDSYATGADGRDPGAAHCDDEVTAGAPSLNGFPLQCGRLEAQQFDNIGAWFPTAAVNRLDLAPADGANCGQQRLIFANNSFVGNGRMFIIVENQIPNPNPGCGVAACQPIAAFWTALAEITDPVERGLRLRDAFLTGDPGLSASGFSPFLDAAHLGADGGQIRTNNFNDSPWTLREFHFGDVNDPPVPVPVAEAPNGTLWNDLSGAPQGAACRDSFLRAAELGLLTENLSAMSFPVDEACKDAESRNDFSQDYAAQLSQGSGAFRDQLAAIGAPSGVSAEELAARARFSGSCMGCHIEAGGSSLGNGLTAPFQFDFVHVNEFGSEECGNGGTCFGISEALRTTFLPHRARVTQSLLNGPTCGGPGPVDPPVDPLPPDGGSAGSGSTEGPSAPPRPARAAVRFTLGGQVADPHAH